jgi:lysine 2,3-aminomutase
MAVPHFVIDAPGGGGKIPLLPDNYLVHLDEDGALLRNYENKTFHYPQPAVESGRELPMVVARSSRDASEEEAYAACSDGYPDRDGFASWGNSCSGDSDDL